MLIEVTPATVSTVGSSMKRTIGTPLLEGAGYANAGGVNLAGAAGDPVLAQVAAEFGKIAVLALRNGAVMADTLGQTLVDGAGAYVLTDHRVM